MAGWLTGPASMAGGLWIQRWIVSARRAEADLAPDGAWILRHGPRHRRLLFAWALIFLVIFALAAYLAAPLAAVLLLAGFCVIILGGLLADARTYARLTDEVIEVRRPIRPPLRAAWDGIERIEYGWHSLLMHRRHGPPLSISIYFDGLGRLRDLLERNAAEALRRSGVSADAGGALDLLPRLDDDEATAKKRLALAQTAWTRREVAPMGLDPSSERLFGILFVASCVLGLLALLFLGPLDDHFLAVALAGAGVALPVTAAFLARAVRGRRAAGRPASIFFVVFWSILAGIAFSGGGLGAVLIVNALPIAGPDEVHVATVLRREGRRDLVVSSWRPGRAEERLHRLDEDLVRRTAAGDSIIVRVRPGLLGWARVVGVEIPAPSHAPSSAVGLRLGDTVAVENEIYSFGARPVSIGERPLGLAEAGSVHAIDADRFVFRRVDLETPPTAPWRRAYGDLGPWLLVDARTGAATTIEAPGFDSTFSAPSFNGPRMAYWAATRGWRETGTGTEMGAGRVLDLDRGEVVADVRLDPPPVLDTDDPWYLDPPRWEGDRVAFRHAGHTWFLLPQHSRTAIMGSRP